MFVAPYTVYVNGLDRPFDHINVNFISDAAQIWADSEYGVVLDDNAQRIPSEILWEILGQ